MKIEINLKIFFLIFLLFIIDNINTYLIFLIFILIHELSHLIVGILIVILSQLILNNYDVQNYINIVGLVLVVYSLKRLCLKYKLVRRLVALLLVIIAILCFIFI